MSRMTNKNGLSKVLNAACDLLFPPRCIGCDELLEPFAKTPAVFCPLCRTAWEAAIAEAAGQSSQDAARGLVYLTFYRSGRTDGVPERLIYHVKHQGDRRTFAFVAERLAPRVLEAAATLPTRAPEGEDKPLLFTYPPRRRSAVSKDGFDQAARLAKALSVACEGDFASLIRRTHRGSAEQKTLDADERAKNAASAYVLSDNAPETVRDRSVVICDDLCTTGATLNRCAALLVEAGARSVVLCTVARTGGMNKHNP
ncbi:MAG: ComF family protein [Clostridia bacterium]|nr:ComF family protein [Clostridia bacterium]